MKGIASSLIVGFCAAFALLIARPAEAQLPRDAWRLSADVDVFSAAGVRVAGNKQHSFGFGPNELGPTRVSGGPTPFGLGVGYVIDPKFLIGVRVGLGYDVYTNDGPGPNTRVLGLSLMPELRFVPLGDKAKLYLAVAPIFQIERTRIDPNTNRNVLGGFGFGVGTFIFVTNSVSVDLGFHFEARFGNYKDDDGDKHSLQDLRGVIRLGFSYWT